MSENLKSVIRLTLGSLGAVLVHKGIANQPTVDAVASGVTEIVLGGLSFGFSLGWSILRNSKIGKYL